MTHPHRWLRAAHKIALNGALFPDASYYRQGGKEGSRPLPTNKRRVSGHRGKCRFPAGLEGTHICVPCRLPVMSQLPLGRGRGNAPPLRCGIFLLPRNPVMVRRFRQVCRGRIYASRAVYPLGCIFRATATGGIYAAPTVYPLYCCPRKKSHYTLHRHTFPNCNNKNAILRKCSRCFIL